jgi:hypothetical protein
VVCGTCTQLRNTVKALLWSHGKERGVEQQEEVVCRLREYVVG